MLQNFILIPIATNWPPGFRCGFLGLLHMEVFIQRLEQEYGISVIGTTPTVPYRVITQGGDETIVSNPSEMPEYARTYYEPTVIGSNLFFTNVRIGPDRIGSRKLGFPLIFFSLVFRVLNFSDHLSIGICQSNHDTLSRTAWKSIGNDLHRFGKGQVQIYSSPKVSSYAPTWMRPSQNLIVAI